MAKLLISIFLFTAILGCTQNNSHAQNNDMKDEKAQPAIGGRCEGCEAIYESKVPFEALNETDTLPLFWEEGPKLVVSGTVYTNAGNPAQGVVIYVYHTDQSGQYRVSGNETGWGKRHGSIRGWMKTNAQGQYQFYTVRPASYSKTGPPAHIHVIVKEPGKNAYWIDDFHFDDDPFLTAEMRQNQRSRGGNGILKLQEKQGRHYGVRNIYLGRNVPDYPSK